MRVANYQATMGTYHHQLWDMILLIIQSAPDTTKTEALNIHTKASTLAIQQRIAYSRHSL